MKLLSIIFLFTFSSISLASVGLHDNRHIAVTGTAKLKAKPDIAIISLEVESLQASSLDAKRDVDERVNNFLNGMSKFNIDEENVSASNLSTDVDYSIINQVKKLHGYIAYRSLKVTLNNINHLNELLDFALEVGINEVDSIEFASSNAEKLKNEVNALAVNNAKEKAKSLANAFDAQLGKIFSINSTSNNSRYRYGSNRDIEVIEVHGIGKSKENRGRYLQENIIFSASISVVFDLDVE